MASIGDVDGKSSSEGWDLEDHVQGLVYGQCTGDAIGLLTEFMSKQEAKECYSDYPHLEFEHIVKDAHRVRWKTGDWTDDSDQMIVTMEMVTDLSGKVSVEDFARRLKKWCHFGFKELGDFVGMGIGTNTDKVLRHKKYTEDPFFAAEDVWAKSNFQSAPNGAVMRTAILGVHEYKSLEAVSENAKQLCKVTHADPRCIASCVAVSVAVALMLQHNPRHLRKDGGLDVDALMKEAYSTAKPYLQGDKYKTYKNDLKRHMFAKNLSTLKLDDGKAIGYTYKALGAGFWALRQQDFRTALESIVREGGDADTNSAVAGALLGCKLGASKLPPSWRDKLLHKEWLDQKILRFLEVEGFRSARDEESKPQAEEHLVSEVESIKDTKE